jgi:cold shock CspA family protein
MEAAGIQTLNEGDRVMFDVQQDTRGQKAVNLKMA